MLISLIFLALKKKGLGIGVFQQKYWTANSEALGLPPYSLWIRFTLKNVSNFLLQFC